MKVESVKAELDEYIKKNTSVITSGVYSDEVQLDKYCKKVSQIKGKYPQFHKVFGRVVQGFKAEWQALGEMQFKAKVLQNFRQKVNLEIIVDEIYNTWLSDLKIEGKTPEEQPISKVIIAELLEKVIDDISDLSIIGDRDGGKADGEFGYSLNGIAKVLSIAQVNTKNPLFTISLNTPTSLNILEEFKDFERSVPSKVRKKVKRIFCSENVRLMHQDSFIEKYGDHTGFNDSRLNVTETYKWEIVGLDNLPDNVIFSTVEDNMLKLVDVIDNPPLITQTQIQDYVLKIFMEFHLGYDFAINELIFLADFGGVKKTGLNNEDLNKLYYSMEQLND
ncbi:hypothetical protein CXF68_09220 [Tenacibaculum sp. Bg11-29]|uniref:hypothetical protein n=1 Tax=Tenacibaculum sp. Bg11-29 TaxID=2058306 RepID=UPI000C33D95D|nr:hypothetical protein [Tenacibaculum sp. Bg11-29]PKH50855.1 hypothetical protein CXF68_09220 [Tenacibaculum sp. Bg11-29]